MPWRSNIVKYFAVTEHYVFHGIRTFGRPRQLFGSRSSPTWTHQLCEALNYLHGREIAHNYLTPHHVLLPSKETS